jgi:hypothetical protein
VTPSSSPLPYHDRKPQGAADFYFAINATFRFIRQRLGYEGLVRYWEDLGRSYLKPVHERWRAGGMPAITAYWRAFFAAEPGGNVKVEESGNTVVLHVRVCPAIAHLRAGGRKILPEFCHHCYHISEAAAHEAGYTIRVKGGAGCCTQTFFRADDAPPSQELDAIRLNGDSAPSNPIPNPQTPNHSS